MALSIFLTTGGGRVFYVQDMQTKIKIDPAFISSIQADGHELGFILSRYSNIPMYRIDANKSSDAARGYAMCWFGDMAKFIVSNLF